MNYWQNTRGNLGGISEWKKDCINYLKSIEDVDFYILQEINPFKLFEAAKNQYVFQMTDYNILYNELKNELLFDGRSENFWGNAIFSHKKFEIERNNIEIDEVSQYYYGRNGLMCYDFISSEDKKSVTIINFYNKCDYANGGSYDTMLDNFENDKDVKNVFEREYNNTILAGDFNKGFNGDKEEEYNNFISSYKNKFGLENCMVNFHKGFIPTYYYQKNNGYYLNDFCFVKNFTDIKMITEQDQWKIDGYGNPWKGLSDHRPLIVELT
jgi:hypothetical protein